MRYVQLFFSFAECFLPLIAVCGVLYARKQEHFSLKIILAAVTTGLLALPPIIAIQTILPQNIPYVIRIFILNGLVEEGVKMLALFLLPYKKVSLKKFFISAVLAGLSLGTFETAVYMLNGQQNILLRIFTAVILHSFCAGLSAFSVWSIRSGKKDISPFIAAIILHTLYNFFAGFSGILWWFSFASIGLAISLCARFYEKFSSDKNQI